MKQNSEKKNGGWRGWDVDAITFNDEVTTGVLRLLLHRLVDVVVRRFITCTISYYYLL